MKEYQYLIVGQGLAGSILAMKLEEARISYKITDEISLSSSSRIAGGLICPVVMKRLTLSDHAQEMMVQASVFYREAERILGSSFYSETKVVKIFGDERDQNFWIQKGRTELKNIIDPEIYPGNYQQHIQAPFGFSHIKVSAIVKIALFLDLLRAKLKNQNKLEEGAFVHQDLQLQQSCIWNDMKFGKVVFCEGHLGRFNPWFSEAGFAPAKGEILTLRIPDLNVTEVVNKGIYLIPVGNDVYRVGSTFSWKELNEDITEEGKTELVDKLKIILACDFEIIDHRAGVRPAAAGRTPLLGTHPQHPQLAIFNGLGTKGAMIGPYYASILLDHLERGTVLGKQVDVRRFF